MKAGSVALTFGGGATAPAAQFPLTTGIPLPIGHLYDPARVALLGAGRQPLEVQTRAIGFWPDGSIRWLLLDFQHDLGVSDSHVVLRYGRDLPRQSAPRALAAEADGGIDIDTGAARLRVPERRPFLPGEVRLAGGGPVTAGGGSAGIHIESAAGSIYTSRGAADTVVIEEAGPLRAVVRLEFRHRDSRGRVLFRSTARIHAYAGKSWFRVGYTFTNDNTEAAFTSIRRLVLATPVPSPPDASAYVLQDLDNHFTYGSDGQNRKEGRRHSGLLLARTGFGACAVAVRDFWQNYPKAIGLGPHGIEVGICPDVSGVNYRVGGYEEDRLFYYLADGAYRFRCGMSRTHDLFYGFAPEGEAAELRRQARAFLTPPVVRARPAVYVRSGAVGQMASPSGATGFYERWLTSARGRFLADRKARRAYGMMNYGDWFGERRYNWGNMEYDTPWVFLNEFLRGGHAQWFELAFRAAQHLVDVDTCHASPGAETVGGQYGHCMGHVGGYYPPGYREASTAVGGMSRDHTWVEGLFLHHSLTGDVRFQEAARTACDRMAEEVDARTFDFSNCRDAGWLLIHLCAGYTATLERRYLEAAHVVVERVIERQRASGGWERMMVPGHCYCDPPRHMGNAAFMVGVLMAGLKRYHLITQDPQVRRCILRAARYAVAAYWVEGQRVFRYTNCPYIWVHVSMNP
ncbi:MAG: hypothetical protein FJX76_27935, partial [Armatimonadetes bacterium]|nr:hypothetical protein [Armatimonadota bacterium]